jgi:general secretion pathway protein H
MAATIRKAAKVKPKTSPAGRAEAGFTLIELLVTLGLAGLLLALVPPLLDKGGDRARLAHDRRLLLAELRLARSSAIASDRAVTVRFDLERRRFGIETPDRPFAGGIDVSLETPLEDRGAIRFFPDGSASGGAITLANAGGRADLAVDWLTGAIR